jgi:hypothetical protein
MTHSAEAADIDEPLVDPHLEMLARVLVLERAADHRDPDIA